MSNSERLNTLIKRSSVNAQMLKKASVLSDARFNKTPAADKTEKTEEVTNKTQYQIGQELKENTKQLYFSASALMKNEDMSDDEFTDAVDKFAKDYSETAKSLSQTTNSLAASSGRKMTDLTASYSSALERTGITVNDDNTLSVDKDKLKNNLDTARNMFRDNYSFGGKLSKKITELESIAQFTGTSIGIYSRTGSFE